MTTITNIAQRILDENNYTTSDISIINLEYLIKNVCDEINSECGTSITFTPGSGTESLTATDAEIVAIKLGAVLYLRAYKDRGPNTAIASLSVSSLTNDPQYSFFSKRFEKALERLKLATREPPIYITNEPTPTTE